ncbi:hypothetical protein [Streptodolium elevatio]
MGNDRRNRRLVVGDTTWRWSVRHRHHDGADGSCAEVLSLRRDGTSAVLRLVFRAGNGRFVADGWWYSGCVTNGRDLLNLHEPGVVRRFVDMAAADGLFPPDAVRGLEVDAWPLYDRLVADGAQDADSPP